MIKKNVKTGIALVSCVVMLLGTMFTVWAEDVQENAVSEELNITEVLVPTKLAAAFNPYGYGVCIGDTVVYDQVISGNYGILNLSTNDKMVWIDITVEDNNGVITFVKSKEAVEQASAGQFAVYLEAVTGILNEVLTEESTSNDLLGVKLSDEEKHSLVITEKGVRIGFKLKGTMSKIGDVLAVTVELPAGTVSGGDMVTVSGGDATVSGGDSKTVYTNEGVTQENYRGFTVKGIMNRNADWSELTEPITINVDYHIEEVPSDMEEMLYGFVK